MSEATEFVRSGRDIPGPRDWILDVFGSFVRDFGGWIAVADLLELIGSLGVSESSGRAALSRMKTQDELLATARGRVRGYALTEPAENWFEDGTSRILKGLPDHVDDSSWIIAAFTVPESERSIRYQIRTRLQNLGFGQLAGGLMLAPAAILSETERALERSGLSRHVELWKSQHVGSTPLEEMVRSAWDLDAIDSAFREYLTLADELEARTNVKSDEDAFVRYMVNINAWRELPFLDPGIPGRYLPDGWPAIDARAAFTRISAEYKPFAWRHFVRTAST